MLQKLRFPMELPASSLGAHRKSSLDKISRLFVVRAILFADAFPGPLVLRVLTHNNERING
jgi:hypothetical protein